MKPLTHRPERSSAEPAKPALLIIDMINDMEFDEGEQLLELCRPAARCVKQLKERFRAAKLPVVYANDNFGKWQSNFHSQFHHCVQPGVRGSEIAKQLKPEEEDYFVLKPKHSAFFNTPLDLLLKHLQVEVLVITGVATDICVFFTGNDAYMRDYQLFVPKDCVAANSQERSDLALNAMAQVLKADIRASTELNIHALWPAQS